MHGWCHPWWLPCILTREWSPAIPAAGERYCRGTRISSSWGYSCDIIHTHTRLTALCPGLPRWASTRKVKPIWVLLKQETVSGSGISWAICKSAPRSRQITMPAPHRSIFIGRMPFLSPNQQCQRYLSIPCLRSIRTRLQAGFLSEGCTRLSTNLPVCHCIILVVMQYTK